MRDKMQDSGVFKIPRVKKRWQSLYCTEPISELDDVWEITESRERNSKNKSTISVPETSKSQTSDRQLLMTAAAADAHQDMSSSNVTEEAMKYISSKGTAVECDFYLMREPLATMDEDRDDCFSVSKNKYTMALLNELSPSPPSSDSQRGGSEFHYQNEQEYVSMTPGNPSWRKPQNNSNQPWSFEKVKGFRHNSPDVSMAERDLDSPQSPDVLIVRDESMANADSPESDVDWDSLTPPAPRSPCDHTVPDLGGLSTLHLPSDFLPYSGPFLTYQMEGQDMSGSSEFDVDWSSLTPPVASSPHDHTVPDIGDLMTLAPPSDFLLYSGPFLTCQIEGQNMSEEQENIQNAIDMHLTY